ncbi:unnamed protein product [Closterium sp. Yama58-4]|nr:unnamed protein product [Closterium sp. Yama58-4]
MLQRSELQRSFRTHPFFHWQVKPAMLLVSAINMPCAPLITLHFIAPRTAVTLKSELSSPHHASSRHASSRHASSHHGFNPMRALEFVQGTQVEQPHRAYSQCVAKSYQPAVLVSAFRVS